MAPQRLERRLRLVDQRIPRRAMPCIAWDRVTDDELDRLEALAVAAAGWPDRQALIAQLAPGDRAWLTDLVARVGRQGTPGPGR